MMDLVLVGLGGILGSILRYKLGSVISNKSRSVYPVGTFIINISGAIFLGIISAIGIKDSFGILIADGFLGAYTTFSTFMYEGFTLFAKNQKANAVAYILATVFIGIIGFLIGFAVIKIFI